MTDPIEISGFPVPPGCELFFRGTDGDIYFRIAGMYNGKLVLLDCVQMSKPILPEVLFGIQSVGYRAWMDEAESLELQLDQAWRNIEVGGRQDLAITMLKKKLDTALANAERCRTWRPK